MESKPVGGKSEISKAEIYESNKAAETFNKNFKLCLEQAGVDYGKVGDLAQVRLRFRDVSPENKQQVIPTELSEFIDSRFPGTPVIDEIDVNRDYVLIRIARDKEGNIATSTADTIAWLESNYGKEAVQDEYKNGMEISKAIPGNIWVNVLPRSSDPYRGLMTYEQKVYFAMEGFVENRAEPKPIDPKVILAIAGMLPNKTLKRNLIGSFPPLAEHEIHNFQVEKEIIIPLARSNTLHPRG